MKKSFLLTVSVFVMLFTYPVANAVSWGGEGFDEAEGLVLIDEERIGVLITEDGWVLSAGGYADEGHSVDVCFFFEDTLGYDCTHNGSGVAYHDDSDLMLYKIDDFDASDEGMSPYEFSDEELSVDDEVTVIGVNSSGNHVEEEQTVTGVANTFKVDWESDGLTGEEDHWASIDLDIPWFYTVSGYGENEVKHGAVFMDGELLGFSSEDYGSEQNISRIISSPLIRWALTHRAENGDLDETFIDSDYEDLMFNSIKIFADVGWDNSLADELAFLKTNDIIDGYPDGYFRASNSINRAELLKMLVESRVSSVSDNYSDCFTDVGTDWYAKYVCYAKNKGWVEGYSDGSFKPATNINRAEALAMIFKVYTGEIDLGDVEEGDEAVCLDVSNSAWYADYVYTADKENILSCDAVAYFDPSNSITREDVSLYLYRLLVGYIQEPV